MKIKDIEIRMCRHKEAGMQDTQMRDGKKSDLEFLVITFHISFLRNICFFLYTYYLNMDVLKFLVNLNFYRLTQNTRNLN